MRRILSNILCWFIPSKLLRRKVREAIDVGVIKYFQVLREDSQCTPKQYLSICAIAKDEGCYFREWLEFHRLVGVDKFYIYDNESSDDTQKILEPYITTGVVEYIYWPGKKQQIPAYADCVQKYKYDTQWLAFIDLDEFIVPVEKQSIRDILQSLPANVSQLLMGWLIYGSSGNVTKPEGLVIENYRYRGDESTSNDYKAILNPRKYLKSVNPHYCICAGKTIDENLMEIISPNLKIPLSNSKIRTHHYHCKSFEEYKHKQVRGDAYYGKSEKYSRHLYDALDRNEIFDPIMDTYIVAVKACISSKGM